MNLFTSISLIVILTAMLVTNLYLGKKRIEELERQQLEKSLADSKLDFWMTVVLLKDEVIDFLRRDIEHNKEVEKKLNNNNENKTNE